MVGCAQDKCTHSHYAGWGCLAKALLHWLNDGVSNNGHGIDHHALVAGLRGIVFPWNIVVVVVARGPLAHAHVLAVAAANGAPNGRGHIFLYVDCLATLVTFYPLALAACFNFIVGFKIRRLQGPNDQNLLERVASRGQLHAADKS